MNSSGLHVSTGSVELGDAGLDPETANRAEIGLHWHNGPLTLAASLYHVRYADFIYLADTGIAEHDGPLHAWTQDDARFSGGEDGMGGDVAHYGRGLRTMHTLSADSSAAHRPTRDPPTE